MFAFMQDYISNSNNKEQILRLELALFFNLEEWEIEEEEQKPNVPDCGYVEPCYGRDHVLWGCLGWIRDL